MRSEGCSDIVREEMGIMTDLGGGGGWTRETYTM